MEREVQWKGGSVKERNGFVREAVRAAIAAGILILMALILAAGVFGADYGVRRASAQTREQIEDIMSSYGLNEQQREALYQEMLERLRELLASGELQFAGSFSPEDARLLRQEIEKHMEETLLDYMTSDQLQKMLEEIMVVLQRDRQETEELLTQLNQMYEQYITAHEQKINHLQMQFQNYQQLQEEALQALEKRLEEELAGIKDSVSELGRVHSSMLQRLTEELTQERQERTSADQSFIEMLQTHIKDASAQLAAEIEKLLSRIVKNEEDIETVFQLVSNGKALLASAITDEGVETAIDATFEAMAENIHKIARLKYEEGKSAAKLIAQYIVNTKDCKSYDDWTYNSYTAPKSGHCWIVGYFLLTGSGGGSGNDIDADAWIEQNGNRIYNNGVHGYIPGTGSNGYVLYVQQQIEVTQGDRFLLGYHIEADSGKDGKRGNTGTMEQITVSLLYPQEGGTVSMQNMTTPLQNLSSLAVLETQGQQAVTSQETEESVMREETEESTAQEKIKESAMREETEENIMQEETEKSAAQEETGENNIEKEEEEKKNEENKDDEEGRESIRESDIDKMPGESDTGKEKAAKETGEEEK